ncbi:hypothetical protein K8I31_19815, partial [bacterium]|nr:hypothetical protein [bacterium]
SITKSFGIEFSTHATGSSVFLTQHPLLTNVSSLGGGGSELIVQPPAVPLAAVKDFATMDQQVVLAAADVGFGRVAAYSDEYLFYNHDLIGNAHYGDNNRIFASNIAHWLLRKESELPPLPTPTPTLMPAPSDADALALLQDVIEVNQPWLNPGPASLSYSLERTFEGVQSIVGSYSVNDGGNSALRVGSILYTALHRLTLPPTNYSVTFAGQAVKDGITTDVLEIVFTSPKKEYIGFGGQGSTSYSQLDAVILSSRIYINSETHTPVFIESVNGLWADAINPADVHSWSFTGGFVEIDGGLAPTEIVFDRPSSFKERQEFQIVDGVWLFKEGESW